MRMCAARCRCDAWGGGWRPAPSRAHMRGARAPLSASSPYCARAYCAVGRRLVAPHCASLRLVAPHCASLRLIAPHCASLRLIAPHCASLRLIAPHCASLRLIARRCALPSSPCCARLWVRGARIAVRKRGGTGGARARARAAWTRTGALRPSPVRMRACACVSVCLCVRAHDHERLHLSHFESTYVSCVCSRGRACVCECAHAPPYWWKRPCAMRLYCAANVQQETETSMESARILGDRSFALLETPASLQACLIAPHRASLRLIAPHCALPAMRRSRCAALVASQQVRRNEASLCR
jgi:hypothetical protein